MTNTHDPIERHDMTTWKDAPTRTIDVDGVTFAYRELGTGSDIPVVFLHHLTAVLDDWDPRVVDGIAAHHRVITFDNRGVGATGGSVPATVEQMGTDAIAFIRCAPGVVRCSCRFKHPGQRDLSVVCVALCRSHLELFRSVLFLNPFPRRAHLWRPIVGLRCTAEPLVTVGIPGHVDCVAVAAAPFGPGAPSSNPRPKDYRTPDHIKTDRRRISLFSNTSQFPYRSSTPCDSGKSRVIRGE